jgi:hypothetical protein
MLSHTAFHRLGLWLLMVLTVSACDPKQPPVTPEGPKTQLAEFAFQGSVSGQTFVIGNTYSSITGWRYQLEDAKMYVSNLRVVREDGSELYLDSIALLNFRNNHSGLLGKVSHAAGEVVDFQIPVGKYKGFRFDVGVPPSMNNTNPAFRPDDHPLNLRQAAGMHWGWADGYVFMLLEGWMDTTATQDGLLNEPIFFHAGNNDLFTQFDFTGDLYAFELPANKEAQLILDLDFNRLFYSSTRQDTIDIKAHPRFHGMGETFDLARRMMLNLREAMYAEVRIVDPLPVLP